MFIGTNKYRLQAVTRDVLVLRRHSSFGTPSRIAVSLVFALAVCGFAFGLPPAVQGSNVTELPVGTVGAKYEAQLKIQIAGQLPFTQSVTEGRLPAGLMMNLMGIIEGSPTAEDDTVFVVTTSDGEGKKQTNAFHILVKGDPSTSEMDLRAYNDRDDKNQKFQIIAGMDQSGIASLPNQTGAFLNVSGRVGTYWRAKFWFRVRLLGEPSASTGGVISTFQDPTGQIKNLDTQKVGQSVDFVFGPDLQFKTLTSHNGRYSMHLIAGVGATTPLSSEDVVNKFSVPGKSSPQCADVISRFTPQNGYPANLILPNSDSSSPNCLANGITVLAFNRQERTNFLRKYLVGIRLMDRYWYGANKECCERGTADFTVGQDETITGGKLHGWVFRVDAVHPLPIKNQSYLYLFGTAALRLSRNQDLRTLILDSDTSNATPGSANVALLPLKQPNKDFYRFGVGLDIKKVFGSLFGQ